MNHFARVPVASAPPLRPPKQPPVDAAPIEECVQ